MKVADLRGREIFDSRGYPTLECEVTLESGASVIASVPSGASTGKNEALELRDGGSRLMGKGVTKSIQIIEDVIAPVFIGQELNAPAMDEILVQLDGTQHKSKLGANTTLAVSMALYRAQSIQEQVSLYEIIAWWCGRESVAMPIPLFNVINGGAHADNNLLIQEIMVVPVGAQNFRDALECSIVLYHELKAILKKKGKSIAVGDEGGFAPQFSDEIEALNILNEALLACDKQRSNIFSVALDMAASQFYKPRLKKYDWHGDQVTADQMIEYYEQLIDNFPIYSIEDGLAETDWAGWKKMMKRLGDRVQIVADDLTVTNPKFIEKCANEQAANAVIIKPNQIGTVTETLQAMQIAEERDMNIIVSHRSGETEDTFIADLAIGAMAGQFKAGGCARGERMAKYNRLLRIEDTLMNLMMDTKLTA
ncbi:phosphopyruvate hydratase [Candidatus Babeliales bacterium]|nr:phosphopyruvate hydratase [Candidatus Babeliales bacterium]